MGAALLVKLEDGREEGGEKGRQQENLGALTERRTCFTVPRVGIHSAWQAGHPSVWVVSQCGSVRYLRLASLLVLIRRFAP